MSGILDLLSSDIGKTLINGASQQLGQDKEKTSSALSSAMPLILAAMKNNASSSDGAAGLMSALNSSKHDGSLLDNLSSTLGGNSIDDSVLSDGAGILGHLFKGKEQNVALAVSKSSGVDMSSAMDLLKVAAPVIMGMLGKKSRQENVSSSSGISDLVGGLLGDGGQSEQNIVMSLLDADGDGSAIDDIAGMLLKGKSGGSGIGGLLGGLFGK